MKHPTLETFLDKVKDHQLTINLDQGLYKDLTIKKPNCIDAHYHITTRPGYLFFTGDMGSFVFSRIDDMFSFFRSEDYSINPTYWSEKVQAESVFGDGVKSYDPEKVRSDLQSELETFIDDLDLDDEDYNDKVEEATNAIDEIDCSDVYELVEAIRSWDPDLAGGLDLCDFWENGTDTHTYYYIWCCFAVVHAINLYDAAKNKVSA